MGVPQEDLVRCWEARTEVGPETWDVDLAPIFPLLNEMTARVTVLRQGEATTYMAEGRLSAIDPVQHASAAEPIPALERLYGSL